MEEKLRLIGGHVGAHWRKCGDSLQEMGPLISSLFLPFILSLPSLYQSQKTASVADPERFDADLDPTIHADAYPIFFS